MNSTDTKITLIFMKIEKTEVWITCEKLLTLTIDTIHRH